MNQPHIVIIGGGFGGLIAAQALGKAAARITLIDRRNHHLFQPLLYQVATAGLSPANIAVPIRAILHGFPNIEVLMSEVIGVNRDRHEVLLADRKLDFDYLVIATGSTHSYFGHDEWASVAPGLKSIQDATRVRQKILMSFEAAEVEADLKKRQELLTFVIVGGGPTGVEMAGAIAELSHFALLRDFRRIDPKQTRIVLVEAGQRLLAAFPESLAQAARGKLERLGVEVRTGVRVERVDARGADISGELLAARTVIWAAGVVASPAGKWLGAEVDRAGRVKVGPDLSVPGNPEIFVIGDTALAMQDGKPLPGLAPVAMQQGRYVGRTILRELRSAAAERSPESRSPFHYRDKGNLATVGRAFAIAQIGNFTISGFVAWLAWLVVHIYYLIDFRNRILVMIEWGWAYLTFQRGARLITSEPTEI